MAFTTEDINIFSHKIENCLNHEDCRRIFKNFLRRARRRDLLLVFDLWVRAEEDLNTDSVYMENDYRDFIEEIDGFSDRILSANVGPLEKLNLVKRECEKILNKIRTQFIHYLKLHHVN